MVLPFDLGFHFESGTQAVNPIDIGANGRGKGLIDCGKWDWKIRAISKDKFHPVTLASRQRIHHAVTRSRQNMGESAQSSQNRLAGIELERALAANVMSHGGANIREHYSNRDKLRSDLNFGAIGNQICALTEKCDLIGRSSFVKSGFDQPNANRAQSHADQGSNTHDFSPPSRDLLRGQILFFAFVFALGLASLIYTIWGSRRRPADPFYPIFGVLAVYLGALGCLIF